MISPNFINACIVVSITLSFFGSSALGSNSTPTQSLTLMWDPSADPNVAGYRLYEGTASKVYTRFEDTGGATAITLSSLARGVTYYLAVTAYDTSGLESPLSGEITYIIPTSAPRGPTLQANLAIDGSSGIILTGAGATGSVYVVQTSRDLSSWSPVGSVTVGTNGTYQFRDPASTLFPYRYYRLLLNPTQPSAPAWR